MSGIKCKYDYPGMPNFERVSGRKAQMQDNSWTIAKVMYVILAILLVYSYSKGDFHIHAINQFMAITGLN
jgi:hypothetical protein